MYNSGSPEVGSVPLHQMTLNMWTFTEKVSKSYGWIQRGYKRGQRTVSGMERMLTNEIEKIESPALIYTWIM